MSPLPVIRNFKQYFWKNLLPAIIIVIGGIVFLNYFLAYRLENYLKQEVKERVAVASDGFYSLTFEDLSINLFNGELKIEGIQLTPNSVVFSQWLTKDSLPLTYLDVSIQQIDFKGINLIWLKNYRKLNFKSFEILHPVVHVTDAFYSDCHVRNVPVKRSKTLYEYIEPYMDVLSVNRLNIKDASASFLVEHPFTPILYKIEDIDFYAYNFQLDSSSFENGKLLYSEHFEFISPRPQTLLANNHFTMSSDSIVVNTRDSLIFLKDVHLQHQNSHDLTVQPSISGEISSLELTGATFKRVNAFNTLQARVLDIDLSDLEISTVSTAGKPENMPDSTSGNSPFHSLSLYDLISPVLNRLSIDVIDIGQGKLDFSAIREGETDNYKIQEYSLRAYDFLIDSIYETRYGIQYIRNFEFMAGGIKAHMPSNNHQLQVDTLIINTEQGILGLKNIISNPVSGKSTYVAGKIPSLLIHGYKYNKGLSVKDVIIEEPNVRYYSSAGKQKTKNKEASLSPWFQYLRVENFHLKKGNVAYREHTNRNNWQAKNINLLLQDLLINEKTLYGPGARGFECNKVELYLNSISNTPGGNPEIKTGKASYSSQSGILELENIQYRSPEAIHQDLSQTYISVYIPHLYINGAESLWSNRQHLNADSIHIEQPEIAIRTALPTEEVQKKQRSIHPFNLF